MSAREQILSENGQTPAQPDVPLGLSSIAFRGTMVAPEWSVEGMIECR